MFIKNGRYGLYFPRNRSGREVRPRRSVITNIGTDIDQSLVGQTYMRFESRDDILSYESTSSQQRIMSTAGDSNSSNRPWQQMSPPIAVTTEFTPTLTRATRTDLWNNTTPKTIGKDTDNQCKNASITSNTQVQSPTAAKEAARTKEQQRFIDDDLIEIIIHSPSSQQSTPSNIDSKPIVSAPEMTASSSSSSRKVQPSATTQPSLAAPVAPDCTPESVEVEKEQEAVETSINYQTGQVQHLQRHRRAYKNFNSRKTIAKLSRIIPLHLLYLFFGYLIFLALYIYYI